jgi:hypothetical protein
MDSGETAAALAASGAGGATTGPTLSPGFGDAAAIVVGPVTALCVPDSSDVGDLVADRSIEELRNDEKTR